jgi:bifunctional non-homologous end joining protein LigD
MLPLTTPLTLVQQPQPFTDPDWLFEVKHDGFRSLAQIHDGCRLVSRKGNEYRRKRLLELAGALSAVTHDVVLDGELVCLDDDGRSLFYDMMFHRETAYFYAFDILWLDGDDLRDRPLLERKQILRQITSAGPGRLLYVDHIEAEGERLFAQVCQRDMEGVVCKPKLSPYKVLRGKSPWIKIKNPAYTQAEGRGDLFHPSG